MPGVGDGLCFGGISLENILLNQETLRSIYASYIGYRYDRRAAMSDKKDEYSPTVAGAISWSAAEERYPESSCRWDVDGGPEWVGTKHGPWPYISWDENGELLAIAEDHEGGYHYAIWDGIDDGWKFSSCSVVIHHALMDPRVTLGLPERGISIDETFSALKWDLAMLDSPAQKDDE